MKLVEVVASKDARFDIKNNTLIYETDLVTGPGILLHADKTGSKDLIITNQIHEGDRVVVQMKSFRIPAKPYKAGEIIAMLMVNE